MHKDKNESPCWAHGVEYSQMLVGSRHIGSGRKTVATGVAVMAGGSKADGLAVLSDLGEHRNANTQVLEVAIQLSSRRAPRRRCISA